MNSCCPGMQLTRHLNLFCLLGGSPSSRRSSSGFLTSSCWALWSVKGSVMPPEEARNRYKARYGRAPSAAANCVRVQ